MWNYWGTNYTQTKINSPPGVFEMPFWPQDIDGILCVVCVMFACALC